MQGIKSPCGNTLENAINAIRRRAQVEYVVWPYWIGSVDNDCWFILADKGQWAGSGGYPLKFYWRMRPTTEAYNDFYTKDYMYSIFLRFSTGYSDPRFVYGSMGAS